MRRYLAKYTHAAVIADAATGALMVETYIYDIDEVMSKIHVLTTSQARELAAELLRAADEADNDPEAV